MRKASVALAVLIAALACAAAPAEAKVAPPRLVIPKLHLDLPIGLSLNSGPAFYPTSGIPGQPYTIAIAGHRTTHTRPFWSIDALHRGDLIEIRWRGVHRYRVTGTQIVLPTQVEIA